MLSYLINLNLHIIWTHKTDLILHLVVSYMCTPCHDSTYDQFLFYLSLDCGNWHLLWITLIMCSCMWFIWLHMHEPTYLQFGLYVNHNLAFVLDHVWAMLDPCILDCVIKLNYVHESSRFLHASCDIYMWHVWLFSTYFHLQRCLHGVLPTSRFAPG